MLRSALVCLVAAAASACADPLVRPDFQQIKTPGSGVVQCEFPTPLAQCVLRVSGHFVYTFEAVLDFGRGVQSPSVALAATVNASYAGGGLGQGHCGVEVWTSTWDAVVLVECHGQSTQGEWGRGFGLMTASRWNVLSASSSTPLLVVAAPGSDVAVLFTVSGALVQCSIESPSAGREHLLPGTPIPSDSRYQVQGVGLDQGQCAFSLRNVTQRDAGVWRWWGVQGQEVAWRATIVLVLAAPVGEPELRVSDRRQLRVGDELTATCVAPPGVPPANLTWVLGDREVLRSATNETLMGDIGQIKLWEPQPVAQSYTRRLSEEDVGQRLECRMEHPGLPGPRSVGLVVAGGSPGNGNQSAPTPIASTPSAPTPNASTTSASTTSTPTPSAPTPNASTTNASTTSAPTTSKQPALVMCPALSTPSVRVRCSLYGRDVDCAGAPVPRGTSALLECREGYAPRGNHSSFQLTNCTDPGRWQPNPLVCDLDCGRRRGGATQQSVGGTEAMESEFPWHVAVFGRTRNTDYQPICGGSLITRSFFVSAGHCFWDNSAKKPMSRSLYKASLGKHTLAWTTLDDHEQRRSIRDIHLPEHFEGYAKRLESDIALVRLMAPVDVTPAVNAVCVDWETTFEGRQLANNSLGTVPGWGLTENDTQSPTLRFVDLPFVPFAECRESSPLGFRLFLLRDKFCGGFRGRSTSVCTGDSGGGFVFPEEEIEPGRTRYFLQGVVSSSPGRQDGVLICQAEYRTAFTKISTFVKWLQEIVFAVTAEEENDY